MLLACKLNNSIQECELDYIDQIDNMCRLYLDGWFVKRKGLAYGIMWAGTGIHCILHNSYSMSSC